MIGAARRGFTVLETLIVVAILAVLVGIAYSATGGVREEARRSLCQAHLHAIGQAIAMYRMDYDGFEGVGRWDQMGLPPSLLPLAERSRRGKVPYLSGGYDTLHCPNVLTRAAAREAAAGRWTDYEYHLLPKGALPPWWPSFPDAVRTRGADFPLVVDPYHDFPDPDLPPGPRLVLVLRMDGRVHATRVPRHAPSWQW